ncbi:MAG: carbamoyltransferase HypF [Candidatus Bathyarchaeota archaeon]|nr:carbamoyltransferase HypF [Candidatus Bathyarchaeota archaeon]
MYIADVERSSKAEIEPHDSEDGKVFRVLESVNQERKQEKLRAELTVAGTVQGVGFRPFIYRIATSNNLKGYVRNRGDAGVEIIVEGRELDIKSFLADLKEKKPLNAVINRISIKHSSERGELTSFKIVSSSKTRELTGSVIPPDIGICNECMKELYSPRNHRLGYFFITCTDCGPRYTAIRKLPYDRQNTVMLDFDLCKHCSKEYSDPNNRRFHAQTIACSTCGPKAYLTTNRGEEVPEKSPIHEAGRLLEDGYLLAIKGNGGFHVASAATNDEPLIKLRGIKHRSQKPFAIMGRNVDTVRSFAIVKPPEAELLTSAAKPIVLLTKLERNDLSELVAPNLHNVGVMLPYTGLHMMLFDEVKEPAFVMTSANSPDEPIVIGNDEALKKLGSTVDYFLFHNRAVAQRCDDSVVRLHGKNVSYIRRSRGYAPVPINLQRQVDECILGVGAEENVTACIIIGDKAFMSQYIGDVQNLETFEFLKKTIRHLELLINAKVEAVACDMHPKFPTTRLAERIAAHMECKPFIVQHHHAHMLSLMGEHRIDEIMGIVCDGYGYGIDRKAWGGEVLQCKKGDFERVGSLQEQPLIGGDLATRYPQRMVAGILGYDREIENWLFANRKYFPQGEKEANAIANFIDSGYAPQTTTSCGRILDAVSAILGLCFERTYQGEPAMKLESLAVDGHDVLKMDPEISNGFLNTTCIVRTVFEARNKLSPKDLAYSAQTYLAKGLAELAVSAASKEELKVIGLSGGVACNYHITSVMREIVEGNNIKFLVHSNLPPGDGGISFGQAIAVANQAS